MESSLITPDLLGFSQVSPNGDVNLLTTSSGIGITPSSAIESSQSMVTPEVLTNSSLGSPPVVVPGTGLLGEYYNGINFDSLQLTRVDPTIRFNWGLGSPGGTVDVDRFSVRWTGKVQAKYSETYTFYTSSDDGIRLWVNGQQLIDNWTLHGLTQDSATITLVAGQQYDIKLDYYEDTGATAASLLWSSVSQVKETIPQSQLYQPDLTLPTANLRMPASKVTSGSTTYQFSVIYADTTEIKTDTIDNQDVVVTGPNQFSQVAKLVSTSGSQSGSPITATYSIDAAGGVWNNDSAGLYKITLQGNQVSDIDNNFIPGSVLGSFWVDFTPPTGIFVETSPVVDGSNRYRFTVVYRDDFSIYNSTINNQEIQVNGPNNFSQNAQLESIVSGQDITTVTTIYSIGAPNDIWDTRSSGQYQVILRANQISDITGNSNALTNLATLNIDLTPPTASLTAPIVTGGQTSSTFTVVYRDNTAVNRATIDSQDVLITGPNNFSQLATLTSVSDTENGSPLTATYTLTAPGEIWDSADTGTYTITLQPNQISDLNGNFIATSVLGTIAVDLTPPTVNLTAPIVVGGQLNSTFTVTYTDTTAVQRSSIDSQNILVTGPNNFSQFATLVSVNGTQDGSPLIATYSLAAPGGVWDSDDTGSYSLELQANQIRDLDGNVIPVTVLGTVAVDLTPPTVSLTAPIVVGGQLNSTFTVTYTDTTTVQRSTIDSQDILVTGPNNFSQFATLVSVSGTQDGSPLTATYSLAAPGGVWDSDDTGTYSITLQPNQISDLNGNFIATSVLGTVTVDLTRPTASLTAPIVVAGQSNSTFTVVYSDTTAVQRSTIDSQDILVTGPNNFSQLATLVSVSSDLDGSPLTATYSLAAPGGVWDSDDTGSYTITLQPNQISDLNGNLMATSVLGTLAVDLTPPTANLTVSNVAIAGQKISTFTVTYRDTTAVQRSSIDGQDVLVTGPNNFSQFATLVSVSSDQDSNALTATYSITAPGETWDVTDAGTYTITLQPNQVSDPNGNFLATGRLGTFWADQGIYTSDFDGDGRLDILLRDTSSQKIAVWLLNGASLKSQAFLPDVPINYTIVDTLDFNGDGKADIRWRDSTNQSIVVWLMNGTTITSEVALTSVIATVPDEIPDEISVNIPINEPIV